LISYEISLILYLISRIGVQPASPSKYTHIQEMEVELSPTETYTQQVDIENVENFSIDDDDHPQEDSKEPMLNK
jgi:hypothetical protein